MIQKNQLIIHETFIIFGAGNTGRKVHAVLNNIGKETYCFLVSSKTTQVELLSEPTVISLDDTARIENKNIPVIIAVFNREKNSHISSIITLLNQKGFTQIITYFEFHAIFAEELGDNFWLTKASFYKDNQNKFKECLLLFNEKKSSLLYKQIIDFLKTFDPILLSEPDLDHQYFPEDLTVWNGEDAFIDLGTYDGQNIIDASQKFGVLSKVIAFEPDPGNLEKVRNRIDWYALAAEAIIFPCGVWEKTQILHFASGNGESCAISDQGNLMIPVVSLDDVLIKVVPGFIKMDIEGAEVAALKGARNYISTYKPSLAISIYHSPDHLFEIPLLINSWHLGYKYYIRFHGNNLFDTVLYCIL